jgi:hypothetical protein
MAADGVTLSEWVATLPKLKEGNGGKGGKVKAKVVVTVAADATVADLDAAIKELKAARAALLKG